MSTNQSPPNRHNASLSPSPQARRSEFEDLIELLGTETPKPLTLGESENSGLRDEEGRLDFAKIRTMFSASPNLQLELCSSNSSGHNTTLLGPQGTLSGSHGTSQVPSHSNLPLENSETSTSPLSPRISKSPTLSIFADGLSPAVAESTPIKSQATLHPNLIDLSSDNSNLERNSPVVIEDKPLLLTSSSTPSFQSNFPEPWRPDFNSIRVALDLANKEVDDLRTRCRELESLIHRSRDRPTSPTIQESNDDYLMDQKSPPRECYQNLQKAPIEEIKEIDGPVNVDSLTYPQSKHVLKCLLDKLGLPSSAVQALYKEDRLTRNSVSSPAASILCRIRRAVDLVIFVDELVWRRSRLGSDYEDPHSEENIEALKERLALWEKTVRTRV